MIHLGERVFVWLTWLSLVILAGCLPRLHSLPVSLAAMLGLPHSAGTPPVIKYSGSPYNLLQGAAVTGLTPTISGSPPTGCSSSPALPTGLTISPASCDITGTPTATQAGTDYTITATNDFGSGTDNINIAVVGWFVNDTWACSLLVSCENVYSFSFPIGSSVAISVFNVTGSSVATLGVFAPTVPLTGPNLLNGLNSAEVCPPPPPPPPAQDQSRNASFTATMAGNYQIAVGRNWGASAGAGGTYTFTITSDLGITYNGQTGTNTATLLVGTSCP